MQILNRATAEQQNEDLKIWWRKRHYSEEERQIDDCRLLSCNNRENNETNTGEKITINLGKIL